MKATVWSKVWALDTPRLLDMGASCAICVLSHRHTAHPESLCVNTQVRICAAL